MNCNEVYARNLRARSHMIAWVGIVSICLVSFVMFIFYKAMSSLSYEQSRWVQLYQQEERSSMNRKLRQRASDLAQEITKQFLLKERSRVQSFGGTVFLQLKHWLNPNRPKSVWKHISRIYSPKTSNQADGSYILYTPLYEWANQQAKSQNLDSAFDLLDADEMTFHKNKDIEDPIGKVRNDFKEEPNVQKNQTFYKKWNIHLFQPKHQSRSQARLLEYIMRKFLQ